MNPTSQLTQIGKYKILSELGRGGMGVVYRAEDKFIGREVAIKTLADATPEMRQRFAIEARSGVLNHPNIVTIYDFGEHEGNPYIVMEFLHGLTLDRIVKENHPLSLVEKLEIVRQICEGLGYAHSRGVVHRDIKPANVVLLQNGGVKLVDFGIAQLESLSGHTVVGSVIGTYQYLSPERLKGEPSDGRGDIWSAGVLLYLLLTGTLPFPGEDISALHRVITDPYPPLRSLLSTAYPESLDNIMARALAKDPAGRYPTAVEMAGDLEATRDAIRLSKVEDLLGQARTLIDKDELLRARPLLLDLQRLAPQNTAVRSMLRELQGRLGQRPELRASTPPEQPAPAADLAGKNGAASVHSSGNGAAVAPASSAGSSLRPDAEAPAQPSPASGEEERRRRIIEQIVVEIRGQAERGHTARALELVQRSLERAPENASLLALQADILGRIDQAQPAGIQDPPPTMPAQAPVPPALSPEPASPQARPTQPEHLGEAGLFPEASQKAAPAPGSAAVSVPPPEPDALPEPDAVSEPAAEPEPLPSFVAPEHVISDRQHQPEVFAQTSASGLRIEEALEASPAFLPEVPEIVSHDTLQEPTAEVAPQAAETASKGWKPIAPAPSSSFVPTAEPAREALPEPAREPAPAQKLIPVILPEILPVYAAETRSQEPSAVTEVSSGAKEPVALPPVTRLQPATVNTAAIPPVRPEKPTRMAGVTWMVLVAAVLAVILVVSLLSRHRSGPALAPVTYAQLVASPYARVLRLSRDAGGDVSLPPGDHMTPLRVDGLQPGSYTLQLQGANGQTTEAQCSVDATRHLCLLAPAPLSDADMESILTGGAHP